MVDDVVVNRVIATPGVAAQRGWEAIGEEVQIGWVRDGDGFAAPPPPVPVPLPSLKKMVFLSLLVSALGEGGQARAIAILSNGPLLLVFAGAEKIDYLDVFVGIDGDPAQPSYTAQLLAAEAVTEAEVAALLAAWPVI
ncbi:hypothetical protein IP70_15615 [alpha proteobacterium AAP38]|nr:hypothetical protein IP70_15615 [alpha proteobacterium AAP38]